MADIRLKKVTVEPNGSPLIIQYGDLKISNTTVSSSAINGALLIEGGVGIKTSVDSTSCTSGGALTIGGGAAILKTLHIGGDSVIDSSIGIFRVKGISQDRMLVDSVINKKIAFAPDGVNTRFEIFDTYLSLNFTKPSSNFTTGGLVLQGGLSISATENAASITQGGALSISGGAAINKKLFVGEGISATGSNTIGNVITVNDFVGIGTVNPLSRLSITPNTIESKITLWDSGSTSAHFGFGVSDNQLNYHVYQSNDRHVFYSGGKNGDGTELMCIQGNGFIGINTSSPTYRLDINGTTRIQSNALLLSNANTVGNLFTTGGNVGVGITSPESKLHVNGAITLDGETVLYGENTDLGNRIQTYITFKPNGSVSDWAHLRQIGSTNAYLMALDIHDDGDEGGFCIRSVTSTGNPDTVNERFRVQANGYIGIGTSSPTTNLDVIGNVKVSNNIESVNSNSTNATIANLILTNITSSNIIASSITASNIIATNGTLTSVSTSNLIVSSGITTATLLTTSHFVGLSNSNTMGAIVTTGGNTGFNTITPSATVDINGTLLCSDTITISKVQASTNSSSGALVITQGGVGINSTENASSITRGGSITSRGGMSIAKDVYIGGVANLKNAVNIDGSISLLQTQNAVSSISGGALTIAGGTSIAKDLYIGGNIVGSGSSSSTFSLLTITATNQAVNLTNGSIITVGGITIQSTANSVSVTNGGSLLVNGGSSIRSDLHVGGKTVVYGSSEYIVASNEVIKLHNSGGVKRFSVNLDTTSNDFSLGRYNLSSAFVENVFSISSSTGLLTFANTTASTSNDTASVIVKGGLSIQNSQDAISTTNGGSLTIAGGTSIRRKLLVGGDVQCLSTTVSTSVSTGALLVAGGVGVSGALNVLGNTVLNGNLTVRGTTTSVESNNTVLKDNLFVLNSGPSGSKDSGFIIQRFQQDNNFGLGDVVNDTRYTVINLPSQFGVPSNQLQLNNSESNIDNYYTGWWVKIASGFSSNQVRKIISYTGSTRIATLSSPFESQNPSENDNIYLYNKSFLGLIYSELDDQFVFGSSVEDPGQSAVAFTDNIPIKLYSGVFTSTQPCTSPSVGSIITNGGITIFNTTDALSLTSGGTLLTLGGAAVGKTLLVGQSVSTNNIYITGNIYQNGNLFVGGGGGGGVSSQWSDGAAGDLYYMLSVGIGTSSPAAKLHVVGSTILSGDVTVGTLVCNNSSFGNLSAQAVGTRMGNIFSNAFNAANNVSSASNVIGFSFSNASIRSFSANVTVSVLKSSGGNLYETFTLEGHQTDSGWTLLPSSFGDVSGITFSITSSGQVQYTSINHSNWTSTVIRFMVSQMYTNGDMTAFSGITSGSIIADSVQINSTSEYISGVNNGAFNVKGGSIFEKGVAIWATENSLGVGTGGGLTVLGGAAISKDLFVGEKILVSGNIGIGTTVPSVKLHVEGTSLFNGQTTIGTLYCEHASIGNLNAQILGTNISDFYSNAFVAANNVVSPSNITGFVFNNSTIRSFTATVSVVVTKSVGGNLYETFTLEGHQTDAGWTLLTSSFGDVSGIGLSMTSFGQVQYTSISHSNWTSTSLRYNVSQIYDTGTYVEVPGITSGTLIVDSIQLNNTSEAIVGISNGGLYSKGGATFEKGIVLSSTENSSLTLLGGAVISKGVIIGESTFLMGNVGIGTTSPSADVHLSKNVDASIGMTISNANTNGNARVNLNMGIGENNGGQFYTMNSDPTFVMRSYSANTSGIALNAASSIGSIRMSTGDVVRMTISSGGNVGIGTTSPGFTLDVTGTARFSTSITTGLLTASNITASNIVATNLTAGSFALTSVNVASGTITNLISTTVSAGTLRYTSAIGSNETLGALLVTGGGLFASFNSNTVGNIVTTGGNVGIGTTSPGATLDVRVAGDNGNLIAQFGSNSGSAAPRILLYDQVFPGSAGPKILFNGGNIGVIQGNGNIALVPSSNVGIGNTSPSITLDVSGSLGLTTGTPWDHMYMTHDGGTAYMRAGGAESGLAFEVGSGSTGSYGGQSYARGMLVAPSGLIDMGDIVGRDAKLNIRDHNGNCISFYYTSTKVGSITANGNSVAYNTTSDYRLKENIEPLVNALTRINQLSVHRFNFKNDTTKTIDGFLAHEVANIVPESINGEKDAVDPDGNMIIQQIDQSKLIPLLTASVQELHQLVKEQTAAIVHTLQNKIEDLQNAIKNLTERLESLENNNRN
jgi:hypothetical protein